MHRVALLACKIKSYSTGMAVLEPALGWARLLSI